MLLTTFYLTISLCFDSPSEELVEGSAVGEPSSPHPDVLLESQVLDLMLDATFLPVAGSLCLVGLDAADVVRGGPHEGLHQPVGLGLFTKNRVFFYYEFFMKDFFFSSWGAFIYYTIVWYITNNLMHSK